MAPPSVEIANFKEKHKQLKNISEGGKKHKIELSFKNPV